MAAQRNSARTMRALLDAGHAVLSEQGAARLTMDAVVKRSGLSKGAVLHHFGTKDVLASRLLADTIDRFGAMVERVRDDDRSPGSYTRAYIRIALEGGDAEHAASMQGVIELARDAQARTLFTAAVRRWSDAIEADGLGRVHAQLLRLAADGLWWCESADAEPLEPGLRADLAALMLSMTR